MSEKLLPCPFCGGEDLSDKEGSTRIRNYRRIACEDCCADAPFTEWNQRADDALRREVTKVRDEMRTRVLSVPVLLAKGYPQPHPKQIEWADRLSKALGHESE